MPRLALLILALATALPLAAQDVSELERRKGFKDLKLGMHIDTVPGEKKFRKDFLEQEEFPANLYAVEGADYESIGEIPVKKVEVKTYKNLVYQINVITDKDPRLMKALESVYGGADYDLKRETYFWKGDTMILKFRSHSRNQLEMIYVSYAILDMMEDDKGKKVDDIADDF